MEKILALRRIFWAQEQMCLLSITIVLLIQESAPETNCGGSARLDAFHPTGNTLSCVFGHLDPILLIHIMALHYGLLPESARVSFLFREVLKEALDGCP